MARRDLSLTPSLLSPQPARRRSPAATAPCSTAPAMRSRCRRATCREEQRSSFFVGNSFFNRNWVVAPASVAAPRRPRPAVQRAIVLRRATSRTAAAGPPEPGEPIDTHAAPDQRPRRRRARRPRCRPVYGDQIQGQRIPGVPREARRVRQLRRDRRRLRRRRTVLAAAADLPDRGDLGYGPIGAAAARLAARVARHHRPRAARSGPRGRPAATRRSGGSRRRRHIGPRQHGLGSA